VDKPTCPQLWLKRDLTCAREGGSC